MMHKSMPCMICHDKGDTMKLTKLQRLQQICNRITVSDITKSPVNTFHWGLNSRCRYGLPCRELDLYDNKCNHIAQTLDKPMIHIALYGDAQEYYNVLNLLRGDFPAVYTAMTKIRAKHEEQENI